MKHRAGLIGYGNMGSWHVDNVNTRIPDLEICAVYDIDPERSKIAAEKGLRICESAEELLSLDIDIVVIATPNNFHKYYAIMAMEAGKNVVCEKPACMNSEELEEIIATSERTGMLFTVHQNRRFDPDYQIMKEIIDNHMYTVERAVAAMKAVGVEPEIVPIRGGTDGARLSFMGLPCPNICTGGENFHSRFEYLPIRSLEKVVDITERLILDAAEVK